MRTRCNTSTGEDLSSNTHPWKSVPSSSSLYLVNMAESESELEPWRPFCKQKGGYEHAVQCNEAISCSWCGLLNPRFLDKSLSSPPSPKAVISIDSSPLAQQTASTPQFPQLDKTSETACQQSIAQTHQKKQEKPHVRSCALSTCPKLSKNTRSQLISEIFSVHICTYYDHTRDMDLYVCNDWKLISQYLIVILIAIF